MYLHGHNNIYAWADYSNAHLDGALHKQSFICGSYKGQKVGSQPMTEFSLTHRCASYMYSVYAKKNEKDTPFFGWGPLKSKKNPQLFKTGGPWCKLWMKKKKKNNALNDKISLIGWHWKFEKIVGHVLVDSWLMNI